MILHLIKKHISYYQWKKQHSNCSIRILGTNRFFQIHVGKYSYGKIHVSFHNNQDILSIGNYVSIASGVKFILGANHRLNSAMTFPVDTLITQTNTMRDAISKGDIVVGDDVWIGTEALIMSGVTIGQGAVIGARAVIAKSVPPYAIVVGNPMRIIRYRFSDELINKLLRINFSLIPRQYFKDNLKAFYASVESNENFIDQMLELYGTDRS